MMKELEFQKGNLKLLNWWSLWCQLNKVMIEQIPHFSLEDEAASLLKIIDNSYSMCCVAVVCVTC